MLDFNDPIIYGAGKTWVAEELREMRDVHKFNINSHWIDSPVCLASPEDAHPVEVHQDEEFKWDMWENKCKVDYGACDLGIVFAKRKDGNLHSGSLVEIGHITASNLYTNIRKPVYIIGSCESFEPVDNSDRAWKSQSIVYHWPQMSILQGFRNAIAHYIANYERDFWQARSPGYDLRKFAGQ